MAKAIYNGVDNVARKVKRPYAGVDNVSRKVTSAYIGVENVARKCLSGGIPISGLSVGDSVYMNFSYGSGIPTPTEFLIIHKGNPNVNKYDSSCDGIWLLIKDCYDVQNYSGAEISNSNKFDGATNSFLNNTVLQCFDKGIQSLIKEIKIPYYVSGEDFTLNTLDSGFPVKLFYLSRPEVNHRTEREYFDGNMLDYFSVSTNRVAYYGGAAVEWWLRTPYNTTSYGVGYVTSGGGLGLGDNAYSQKKGCRFALVLPHETLMDSNFNVIA